MSDEKLEVDEFEDEDGTLFSVKLEDSDVEDYDLVVLMHKRHESLECEGVKILPLNCTRETAEKVAIITGLAIVSGKQYKKEQKYDA